MQSENEPSQSITIQSTRDPEHQTNSALVLSTDVERTEFVMLKASQLKRKACDSARRQVLLTPESIPKKPLKVV